MAPCFLLVLLALLLPGPAPSLGAGFGAGVGAINITHILAGFPEFSAFSAMLSETSVAFAIEGRDKVTVLAPNNTAVAAAFPGLPRPRAPRSFLADLLALHVVLDYIDEPKLGALQRGGRRPGEGSVLATLLQATRTPDRGAGFLRVYSGEGGRSTFTSAAPAGFRNATFERLVAAQPDSVAVLQVSGFVVPPGIRVPRPFPPTPRARHMAAPPGQAPAAAPGPHAQAPIFESGPLVPSPVRPMPTPYLIDTPPPVPDETGVIPIPSVHGGMAAKLPSAAGYSAAIWWAGVAAVIGITCMHLHL